MIGFKLDVEMFALSNCEVVLYLGEKISCRMNPNWWSFGEGGLICICLFGVLIIFKEAMKSMMKELRDDISGEGCKHSDCLMEEIVVKSLFIQI
jgi:hypothetical protein